MATAQAVGCKAYRCEPHTRQTGARGAPHPPPALSCKIHALFERCRCSRRPTPSATRQQPPAGTLASEEVATAPSQPGCPSPSLGTPSSGLRPLSEENSEGAPQRWSSKSGVL